MSETSDGGEKFLREKTSLIAIALTIRILARTMAYIGRLDFKTYALGLIGLTTIMLLLKAVMKAAARLNPKRAFSAIVLCLTLVQDSIRLQPR